MSSDIVCGLTALSPEISLALHVIINVALVTMHVWQKVSFYKFCVQKLYQAGFWIGSKTKGLQSRSNDRKPQNETNN